MFIRLSETFLFLECITKFVSPPNDVLSVNVMLLIFIDSEIVEFLYVMYSYIIPSLCS
jgi:hypothetical protein